MCLKFSPISFFAPLSRPEYGNAKLSPSSCVCIAFEAVSWVQVSLCRVSSKRRRGGYLSFIDVCWRSWLGQVDHLGRTDGRTHNVLTSGKEKYRKENKSGDQRAKRRRHEPQGVVPGV